MGMGTRMGMYDSIPKVQDWEGDELDPFPKLGNEKGMKKKNSQNWGMGRE